VFYEKSEVPDPIEEILKGARYFLQELEKESKPRPREAFHRDTKPRKTWLKF